METKKSLKISKKHAPDPISPAFIQLLKEELKENTDQKPSELIHLLTQKYIPPASNILNPIIAEIDTLENHFEFLNTKPISEIEILPKINNQEFSLPYVKRIIFENVIFKEFQANLTRKFIIDDRLINRPTLERVGLVKNMEGYEKNKNIPIGDKSYHKFNSIDILSLLNSYSDLFLEYGNMANPEQSERTCVFHILNHVLKREKIISENDEVFKEIEGIDKKKGLDLADFEEENESENEENLIEKENEEGVESKENNGIDKEADNENSENESQEMPEKEEENFEMIAPYTKSENFTKHIKALISAPNNDAKYELIKDQGFTKGKVLIICPFKKQAFDIVSEIVTQFRHKWKGVTKKKKFKEEYGSEDEFSNDCFRLGLSFYGKTLKLYSTFKKSDIIIASPLGLRTILQENDQKDSQTMKYDFLSSIEIVLLTSSHLFLYQNIDHLEEIITNVNEFPTKTDGLTDINRIMNVFLDKKGKQLKQTIMLSKFNSLELSYIFKKCSSTNYLGKLIIPYEFQCPLSKELIVKNIKISLRKIPVGDLETAAERKFDYFTKKIWPKLYENCKSYTILYVPTYFDFMRLKKYFNDTHASVGCISEYTKKGACQGQRALYETRRIRFLMYTERAQYFELVKLRFARHLIFYGIPENPDFLTEMIDLLNPEKEELIQKVAETQKSMQKGEQTEEEQIEENKWDIYIHYTKHDENQLQRIVGTAHVNRYLTTENNISLI